MDMMSRTALLERVALFAAVTPEGIGAVAEAAHERRLSKGEALFRQGDEAVHNYVVGTGRLRLDQTTADGQNLVLRYMGPGDLVGTVAVLRRIPFPATPTAIEDCEILAWSAGRLADLMARWPAIALNAVQVVGGRVEELQERLREVATLRVERRIAATLLRMIRQVGRPVEGGVEIPFVISRNELAEMTATTLHTVSRTLAAWEQEGILSGKRATHLVIARPRRLQEIAELA